MLTGVVLAALPGVPGMGRAEVLGLLGAGAVALLAADMVRLRVPALNRWAFRALPSLASPREARRIASSTWYVVGALLTFAIFPVRVAVASVAVLALADPAASVVGRIWGRRPAGKGSVEGAAAFLVVAFAVLLALLGPGPATAVRALAVAAVATGVELAPLGVDDNVSVPLATGAVLWVVLGVG